MTTKKNAAQAGTRTASNTNHNFTPKTPNPGTQTARLLEVLMTGRTITPQQAWAELSIMRVADPVFKLRGMGWEIDTIHTDGINQFGEPVNFASYRLTGGA